MRAHFGLPSVESDELEARRPITVNFEIPYFTVSGIQVGTFNHQPADLIPLLCFTNASFHIHTRLRCCIDGNVNVMLIIDFKQVTYQVFPQARKLLLFKNQLTHSITAPLNSGVNLTQGAAVKPLIANIIFTVLHMILLLILSSV